MSTAASSPNPGAVALVPREILGLAWPLFKRCLPVCLPLAVIGVAAGATPGAEAVASGEARGLSHSREWWGLTCASIVLTLICYGAVLRQQLALAAGTRVPVLESLLRAARDLPTLVPLLLLLAMTLLPAMAVTAWQGFGLVSAALTLAALLLLVNAWLAWPALSSRGLAPWTALVVSRGLVRGRWLQFAKVLAMLVAAVLVFVMLVGIFIGMVMELATQSTQGAGSIAFSRWLMAVILALPVVYAGAVTVVVWNAVSGAPASHDAAAPRPAA